MIAIRWRCEGAMAIMRERCSMAVSHADPCNTQPASTCWHNRLFPRVHTPRTVSVLWLSCSVSLLNRCFSMEVSSSPERILLRSIIQKVGNIDNCIHNHYIATASPLLSSTLLLQSEYIIRHDSHLLPLLELRYISYLQLLSFIAKSD